MKILWSALLHRATIKISGNNHLNLSFKQPNSPKQPFQFPKSQQSFKLLNTNLRDNSSSTISSTRRHLRAVSTRQAAHQSCTSNRLFFKLKFQLPMSIVAKGQPISATARVRVLTTVTRGGSVAPPTAKVLYASHAWWGFTSPTDRQMITAFFIHRSIWTGFFYSRFRTLLQTLHVI